MRKIEIDGPLVVAIPELSTYSAHTGIGRVLHSLSDHWGERVCQRNADFEVYNLPLVRNVPLGVRMHEQADLVLLPKVTGAPALRDTKGVPSIVIVHDLGIMDFPADREGLDWLTYQMIMYSFRSMQHAARVVTVSRFSLDRLIQYFPALAGRVRVVPNGVSAIFLEHSRLRDESRHHLERLLGRRLGEPALVNVGSEIPRKNVPLLLQVFKRIKDMYPAAQLLKVGGPGKPCWRARTIRSAELLGLRVGADMLLLENIDDQTLADAYRAADVFVSTSLYEGFGLPALEAMSVGTPVVVAHRGALPEVIGDIGWSVEPEVEPFVQAISEALTSGSHASRVQRGKARAASFSWSRSAEQYLEIMLELSEQTAIQRGGTL